ncbi:MAG: hypothetical protein HY904_06550 [Deltaproteobacteria bacterium]|nr:hypothetical protein [Deltaproteobacteria bacterium]
MTIVEFFRTAFTEAELMQRRASMSNEEWTLHLGRAAAECAGRVGLYCATKGAPDAFGRAEYFTLDVTMMEAGHPTDPVTEVSYPPPAITMEFENLPEKITYDYWKLVCVRSALRVLVYVLPDYETANAAVLARLVLSLTLQSRAEGVSSRS